MADQTAPDEQTADRRARYAAALKNIRMMRDGKNLDRQIDAIIAVADAERENDRLTLEHDRRYIARLDFEYDNLRKENARLRAELEQAQGRALTPAVYAHLNNRANAIAAELDQRLTRLRNTESEHTRGETVGMRDALGILLNPPGSNPSQRFIEHVGDNGHLNWQREQRDRLAAAEQVRRAPQCTASLGPEPFARCVRHGQHDSHKTAAGALWGNGSADETTWAIEVLFRGEWKPFTANLTTLASADDSYQAAISGSPDHAFRLVRSDTVHTITAEHDPNGEETQP